MSKELMLDKSTMIVSETNKKGIMICQSGLLKIYGRH